MTAILMARSLEWEIGNGDQGVDIPRNCIHRCSLERDFEFRLSIVSSLENFSFCSPMKTHIVILYLPCFDLVIVQSM